MSKLFMFVERDGQPPQEVPVDPAHVDRQVRDLRAAGWTVTVVDEDERIDYGRLSQRLGALR